MITCMFEHFYFAFAFYDNNAQYPAQRVQHFKPATDLNFVVRIAGKYYTLQCLSSKVLCQNDLFLKTQKHIFSICISKWNNTSLQSS